MRKRFFVVSLLLVSLAATTLFAETLQPTATYTVKGRISDNQELSGIAKLGNSVLICGDEVNTGQILEIDVAAKTITPGKKIKLASGPELDAEGIATDGASFYVTGSHGISRNSQSYKPERYQFTRIDPSGRLVGKGTFSNAIKSDAVLGKHFKMKLQGNGINIEGLTYWNGKLYVGFRSPNNGGTAYLMSMDPSTALASGEAHALHPLSLGAGTGVRSLETTSRGILILTGASDPDGSKTAMVYEWTGGGARYLATLGGLSGKPEAMLLLGEPAGAYEVLIFSDGVTNGAPSSYRVPR